MDPKDKRLADAARGVILSTPASIVHELGKEPELPTWVAPRWIKYVISRGIFPLIRNILRGTGPTRLVLKAPVRHGKTVLFGYATPLWALMLYPTWRYILGTHTDMLAVAHTRMVRDALVLKGPEWVGWEPLGGKTAAAGNWETPYRGGMLARGVGGGWSGIGGKIISIDDPYKNAQEARSGKRRQAIWDWFKGDVLQRLEPSAGLIVSHARWHQDDLIGRLEREYGDNSNYIFINLPAIAGEGDELGREPGEALWPDRFSREVLAERRKEATEYYWRALWQQEPSDDDSGYFSEKNLREWKWDDGQYFAPDGVGYRPEDLTYYAICDTAMTTGKDSDYTALTTFAAAHLEATRPLLFVVDCVRRKLESPNILPLISERMRQEPRIEFVGIEGKQIYQFARAEGINARELKAITDKKVRAIQAAVAWENGRVLMPTNDWAPWVDEFTSELYAFPVGSHDDMVDTLAYGAEELERWYVPV